MSPERWQKIEEVFQAVVDLAPEERLAYLTKDHADDEDLITEINKLISDYDEAGDFIESPVWTDSFMLGETIRDQISDSIDSEINHDNGAMIGRRLGVYLLTKELGRGGMGAVYLAERADGEFRQRVALKVIKRGMDTDFIVRRFRNERQILASLDHPNIARLLDGGTTSDGLPFFVMEYIEGEPVYHYADSQKLNINERLQLFRRICAAVDHAHRRQIIHRDIKPSNIMITANGMPKLLDFGIAKILDPELAADSIDPTATAMRMMTPEYASPEQVRGEPVTKASDIYSLGVLLYELLTGHRPYRLKNRALHEIARVVCEEQPESLSASLTREDNIVSTRESEDFTPLEFIFENRNANLEALRRELSGDLEKIVLKAMRKNPTERYQSAGEFAEDILRYLESRPVIAEVFHADSIKPEKHTLKTRSDEISVAVLPLKLLGAARHDDTGDEYLCIGLADALITRLSNVRRFIIRPTSSVLKYGNYDIEPITAGAELGVDYVIDGNIRRVGTKLRVTVQLLNIEEGAARWAEKFDEEFTDVLSLEDLISEKVAQAILPQITGDERQSVVARGTDNAEAYQAYLRGRFHWHSYTVEGLAKSLICFYQAIALDPNFAAAHSGVADYYNFLSIFGIMSPVETFQAAKEAALKAVELDENLADAHVSLAIVALGYDWDFAAAEKHLDRAFDLNPNYAEAFVWRGHLLSLQGRHDEAISAVQRAEQLNPQSPSLLVSFAIILRNARRYEEGLGKIRRALLFQPKNPTALAGFTWFAKPLGNHEEAEKMCRQAVEVSSRQNLPLCAYGYALAVAGKHDEAREIAAELERNREKQYVPPIYLVFIYTELGEYDLTFKWLGKSFDERDFWAIWLPVDARFDVLKNDPRYDYYLGKIKPAGETKDDIHASHIATRILPPVSTTGNIQEKTPTSETKDFAPDATKKPRRNLLAYAIAGAILLAIVGIVLFRGTRTIPGGYEFSFGAQKENPPVAPTPPSISKQKKIAVLPFKTDSQGGKEEQLGSGLAESLYRKLGQIKELSVSPAMINLPREQTPKEIGASFGVSYILRGTLHNAGDQLQVSAELIDTITEKILWAETFDETLDDLPNLQVSISDKVLKALTIELTSADQRKINKSYTSNTEAYQLYLGGRYLMKTRSADNIHKAIELFNKSREKDVNYALAYSGLADAYALLNLYEIPPPEDAYAKAKENALKALQIDDNLAEAHASLGYILFYGEQKRSEAEAEFHRALELNPSYSTVYHWSGLAYAAMGKADESIANINKAMELEPRSAIVHSAAGLVYFYARRYDEALTFTRKSLEIDNGFVPAHKTMRVIYEAVGNYDEANNAYQKERLFAGNSDANEPGWLMITAQVQATGSKRDEALANLKKVSASNFIKNNPKAYAFEVAIAYALLGENDNAISWLEKSAAVHSQGFNFAKVDARLDKIKDDPRFREIVKVWE